MEMLLVTSDPTVKTTDARRWKKTREWARGIALQGRYKEKAMAAPTPASYRLPWPFTATGVITYQKGVDGTVDDCNEVNVRAVAALQESY